MRRSPPSAETVERSTGPGLLEAAALALVAARWLTPAEGVARGETLWLAQAWLVWGFLAAWSAVRNGVAWRVRWTPFSGSLALLIGGHIVSAAVVLATDGQKRAALNGLWEWTSLAVTAAWLSARGRDAGFRRAFSILLVSATAALCGLGLWQRYVWQPRVAAAVLEFDQLERDVPGLSGAEARRAQSRLRELRAEIGPEYLALDANGRMSLRQRLIDSTEPLGRFALTNTFAALLAAAWLIGFGLQAQPGTGARIVHWSVQGAIACVLLLTKSRTAWVGTLAGLVVGGLQWFRGRREESASTESAESARRSQRLRRRMFAGLVAAAAIIALAWSTGGIDRLVFSEAPKSLQYRLEYWRGTWGVIAEHPWLGVGTGNFRQHYLGKKLAGSSEEILDPHNLYLDAWANGGLLALAGALGLTVLTLLSVLRGHQRDPGSEGASVAGRLAPSALIAAGLLVAVHGWVFLGEFDLQAAGLGAATAVVALILQRTTTSTLAPAAIGAAWCGLTVHLLGAGGIGMPAISQLWIALAAMAIPLPREVGVRDVGFAGRLPVVAAGTLLALAAAQLLTTTRPVLTARALLAAADYDASVRGDLRAAGRLAREAADMDPLDPEPRRRLAQIAIANWRTLRAPAAFEEAVAEHRAAIDRDPRNPHDARSLASLYLERFERTGAEADAEEALRWSQRALDAYPQHSFTLAVQARALAAAGDRDAARDAAARALELDALNRRLGHSDRLLPQATVDDLQALGAAAD
ncbi:MAG: O-antigen ligase family protein [Planctomyces sp.]|nr:O-antigen ligase family protein [Planctomyces sp.]